MLYIIHRYFAFQAFETALSRRAGIRNRAIDKRQKEVDYDLGTEPKMPYKITYDPEADCINASITGKFDPSLVKEFLQAMAALAREKNCTRVLTDMRAAKPQMSVLEIDDLPRFAAETGLDFTVRRALVIADDYDDYSFYRASSAIQGQNVRIFRDIDDARAWLFENEDDTP